MTCLSPFKGYLPIASLSAQLAAPPYDVVDLQQVKAICGDNEHSTLHITRPDGPTGELMNASALNYAKDFLTELVAQKKIMPEDHACYYLYEIASNGHRQLGLVGLIPNDAKVCTHEQTKANKVKERSALLSGLAAQVSPILMALDPKDWQVQLSSYTPEHWPHEVSYEGFVHRLAALGPEQTAQLAEALRQVPQLYIADGHHRYAAAFDANFGALAVVFPANELQLLGYHRLLTPIDLSMESLCDGLRQQGIEFQEASGPEQAPEASNQALLGYRGRWLLLSDPMGGDIPPIPASWTQEKILGPLLAVADPRTDERLRFVGGKQAPAELALALTEDESALVLILPPATMEMLLSVANRGGTMPPKSTWFEPKLLDGLVFHIP